ncbi:hypothetical protein C0991_007396 [Blastosporella zonata]|nr:hypothetical protein C0991_007396 [Blastosporella zonata]
MVNTRFSSYIKPGLAKTLPEDLKREILEITASLYPPFALRMALVSREIQTWAERIIYHNIFFSGQLMRDRADKTPLQKFRDTLEARPAAFFAEYVRGLHFDGACTAWEILRVVKVCTGVKNFGIYANIEGPDALEIARIVHALPLHTLFISNKNLAELLTLDVESPPLPTDNEESNKIDEPDADMTQTDDSVPDQIKQGRPPLPPVPSSSLHTLQRLGIVDGFQYPSRRFPALTHLALMYNSDDQIIKHVHKALNDTRIESLVIMLNYLNAPHQMGTLRTLWDIIHPKLVLFTLPFSPTCYIDDDLWDLANEFPDEDQPISRSSFDFVFIVELIQVGQGTSKRFLVQGCFRSRK